MTVDNISIKLNSPYAVLNGESSVDEKFEVINEKSKEDFYYGDKRIVKGICALEDTAFSKEELKQNSNQLKEILPFIECQHQPSRLLITVFTFYMGNI